ncbi:sensor histidine kinase [Candidatus Methylobacter oryzae]|uniref:histidine kinase n=1 Tax=Candidatus Methylobacter oryzae TaxID=2497749 RepID=A0ABY3CMH6_9GAMM|nr:PAS domain-containing sensor histidine kinase [Candidatus Methylobacter oryzae]TRX03261.1 two-component sensor histidine kinase [Candidatus Methylobacter oryzae]
MPIHRILLISFLLLLLLATVPIVGLSFYASRVALEAEIGRNLKNDAAMLMEQIDMLIFERLQNVHSWSHLDIIQEGRIGDIDKRLAQFLGELERGYPGVYRNLFYLDKDNRIVAAGDPALIKQVFQPPGDWIHAQVPHGEVFLETLQLQPPYEQADLLIRAPVHDSYASGDIGQLYGVFDLRQIFRLFDQASHSDSGERFVILLDADGRTIASSATAREQKLLLTDTFAGWRLAEANGIAVHTGKPLTDSSVLVGYAVSKGYQDYANMGWSLLVIQSTQQAFQPIWALWWLFFAAFITTGLIASGVAQWVAGRVAKPLLDLTAWVRCFQKSSDCISPAVSGAREVRELSSAFGQLIEDLERSRQQVVHAAKLAVVGEMAAIMAHEVRTPLGILQTTAQMLQWETALSPEGREMTQMIADESTRLNRLISTLLDCARPRQPNMQSQDLHKIIARVIDLLATQAQKKSIQVDWSMPEHAAIIECDQELLVQVFLNLILNAIQIIPANGRIRVHTDCSGSESVKIAIEDNGPGIPADNCARLFDPFFTTREGGIGLGLTVTQQIVSVHKGHISADKSGLGGACFTLFLPFSQEQKIC